MLEHISRYIGVSLIPNMNPKISIQFLQFFGSNPIIFITKTCHNLRTTLMILSTCIMKCTFIDIYNNRDNIDSFNNLKKISTESSQKMF